MSGNALFSLIILLVVAAALVTGVIRGAGRVAKVAVHALLDTLHGQQMRIEADLRNGNIDRNETTHRRTLLDDETQLHAAIAA